MLLSGDHNRGVARVQGFANIAAQFLDQEFILRIKLDTVLMVAVLRPRTMVHVSMRMLFACD